MGKKRSVISSTPVDDFYMGPLGTIAEQANYDRKKREARQTTYQLAAHQPHRVIRYQLNTPVAIAAEV